MTVSGVSPATTYRFDVVSGATTDSSGGTHYAVTTGATLGLTSPDVAYGTVTKRDGGVPDGAIVTLTATSAAGTSAPLTSVMVAAGLLAGWLVDVFTPLSFAVPIWGIVVAFLSATSVGLFFGIYPAVKAARLDPVESLRYE